MTYSIWENYAVLLEGLEHSWSLVSERGFGTNLQILRDDLVCVSVCVCLQIFFFFTLTYSGSSEKVRVD